MRFFASGHSPPRITSAMGTMMRREEIFPVRLLAPAYSGRGRALIVGEFCKGSALIQSATWFPDSCKWQCLPSKLIFTAVSELRSKGIATPASTHSRSGPLGVESKGRLSLLDLRRRLKIEGDFYSCPRNMGNWLTTWVSLRRLGIFREYEVIGRVSIG